MPSLLPSKEPGTEPIRLVASDSSFDPPLNAAREKKSGSMTRLDTVLDETRHHEQETRSNGSNGGRASNGDAEWARMASTPPGAPLDTPTNGIVTDGLPPEPISTPGSASTKLSPISATLPNGLLFKPSDGTSSESPVKQRLDIPTSAPGPSFAPATRRIHSASDPDPPPASLLKFNDNGRPLSNQTLKPVMSPSPNPPGPFKLQHRHTLQLPKPTAHRGSRDLIWANSNASEDQLASGGGDIRRRSLNLVRRTTRSGQSDMYMDDIPQDADAARWTEKIQQKRMSRRRRKEEEEDDRVMVGTKVDQNHGNYVTAYNMLTGIRFTVSRCNAKVDRELTDDDFKARHKFSFDISGNELTPSAKYDFKFKDYAPWVFRHLRAIFHLDPADYLVSLTSKYILSELGSPGKSGSFFYFSRDYKYIIKTIHPAEHKMLRKVLREYYNHVIANPNTLISQFYGLHRVKIPYGRKIHFVVMNNLFPPHRDIHETFDLKGSTIGREFKEAELAKNPRATLKDLNWLRRDHHLELGREKKETFIEQMKRDVALLQRLNIMDYSLLVGIHDLSKGNEENLRDKTLQVFEPGREGDDPEQREASFTLMRTPSKIEKQRKVRELRQAVKRERPIPMEKSSMGMPENIMDTKKHFFFYSDDGGIRATHEDGSPSDEIYYLGIIDCLTKVRRITETLLHVLTGDQYGFVKHVENFIKGLSADKMQISPVKPEYYGDRFIKFISACTMTQEEADRQRSIAGTQDRPGGTSIITQRRGDSGDGRGSQDRIMEKAEKEAMKPSTEPDIDMPDRTLAAARSLSTDRAAGTTGTTLPVLEEAAENASVGGKSRHSSRRDLRSDGGGTGVGSATGSRERESAAMPITGLPSTRSPQPMSPPLGGYPPPTPPKEAPPVQDPPPVDDTPPKIPLPALGQQRLSLGLERS